MINSPRAFRIESSSLFTACRFLSSNESWTTFNEKSRRGRRERGRRRKKEREIIRLGRRYHFQAGSRGSLQKAWKELSSGAFIDNGLSRWLVKPRLFPAMRRRRRKKTFKASARGVKYLNEELCWRHAGIARFSPRRGSARTNLRDAISGGFHPAKQRATDSNLFRLVSMPKGRRRRSTENKLCLEIPRGAVPASRRENVPLGPARRE